MSFTIILLASFFCLIVWLMSASSKRAKALRELADRRQRYVESISPNARIIVNNGIHLFFKDDVQQFFGFDESGNTYDFAGLFNISTYKYGIRFYHKDSMDILIGKDYGRPSITYPLPTSQIDAIAREMIPVLRNNLYAELEKEGVTPTHEYEHDGCIWGCDINNKKFFMTYGCIQIFNFSDLKRVTVEDLTKTVSVTTTTSFTYLHDRTVIWMVLITKYRFIRRMRPSTSSFLCLRVSVTANCDDCCRRPPNLGGLLYVKW